MVPKWTVFYDDLATLKRSAAITIPAIYDKWLANDLPRTFDGRCGQHKTISGRFTFLQQRPDCDFAFILVRCRTSRSGASSLAVTRTKVTDAQMDSYLRKL
jgi:hypothetical protein